MKVKVISRNPNEYLRETKRDIHKLPRNYDPSLHPFEAAREYVRALNATKLDKVFAKPFVGSLDGHKDAITSITVHPKQLSRVLSGAYDGEVKVWDVARRIELRSIQAHEGIIRDLVYTPDGKQFLTIGDDKIIKVWSDQIPQFGEDDEPINSILSRTVLTSLSYNKKQPLFVSCGGEVCQLWEESRNEPLRTFQWGVDSLIDVKFNPVQTNLFSTCGGDRSIILYDIRDTGPLRKVILKLRTNKLCWNPMEAFMFTAANEDYNLYSFDTRNLKRPVNIHMDHVGAVVSIDYSPTGREFVTGSYDKSVRIFECDKGHSRDVYHTKRMQRLTCVQWSLDNKYIFSGSDEMNVRIWKARASEKLGPLKPRERSALNYSEALKEKYAAHPQIKRINRHRHVPKHIYNAQKELRVIKEKMKRKESNSRAHSKPGKVPYVPERRKHIVKEEL